MNNTTRVYWKCPHCGYTDKTFIDLRRETRVVTPAMCSGCEKTVVVLVPMIWGEAYKVVGMDDRPGESSNETE
jgi:transcription elongation factor Elf1